MKESYLEKARRLYEEGDYQKALFVISRGLLTQPSNLEAISLKCQCLMELGRYREVIATIEGVPQTLQTDVDLQILKGEAYYFLRDFKKAFRILNDVFSFDTKNKRVQLLLEQILLEEQKKHGHKPIVVGNGDADDLYGWGEVLESLGLSPDELPPEFLTKIGDDTTNLDLPENIDEEDPTQTMPMEAPPWLDNYLGSEWNNQEEDQTSLDIDEEGEQTVVDEDDDEIDTIQKIVKGNFDNVPTQVPKNPIINKHENTKKARYEEYTVNLEANTQQLREKRINTQHQQQISEEEFEELPTKDYLEVINKNKNNKKINNIEELSTKDYLISSGEEEEEPPTREYNLGKSNPKPKVTSPYLDSEQKNIKKINNIEELSTKDYLISSGEEEEEPPTREYNLGKSNPKHKVTSPSNKNNLEEDDDFVMSFHSIDNLEAPPQEELEEVEGEIEVEHEDSFFTEDPELPSISVDFSSIEELPSIPEYHLPQRFDNPFRPKKEVSRIEKILSDGSVRQEDLFKAIISPKAPSIPLPPPPAKDVEIERIIEKAIRTHDAAPTMPIQKLDSTDLFEVSKKQKKKPNYLKLMFFLILLFLGTIIVSTYFIVKKPSLPPQKELLTKISKTEGQNLKKLVKRIVELELNYPDKKWLNRLHIMGYLKARISGWYSPPLPKPNVGDPLIDGLLEAYNCVEEGRAVEAMQKIKKLDSYLSSCDMCMSIAARLYIILGDFKKADNLLQSLKFKGTLSEEDACWLANIKIKQQNLKESEELLNYFVPIYKKSLCLKAMQLQLGMAKYESPVKLNNSMAILLNNNKASPRFKVWLQLIQVRLIARMGQTKEALDTLETLKELIPDWDLYMLTEYVESSIELGKYKEASEILKHILSKISYHERAIELQREVLFRLGNIRKLFKFSRKSHSDPILVMAYLIYGDLKRAYQSLGMVNTSSSLLKRIAGAVLQVKAGKYNEANELLGVKPSEFTPYAPLWAWAKGEILVAKGVNCLDAVKPLMKFGKKALLWKRLVELECLLRKRKWVRAVKQFNKAVKEFNSADALEPLGFSVLRVMGNFKVLIPKLQEYIKFLSSVHFQWYLYLVEAQRNMLQWDEARATLYEASKHSLPLELYYLELAKIYMKRKYWTSTIKTLKKLRGVSSPSIAMKRDIYYAVALSHKNPKKAFEILEPYSSVYNSLVYWAFAQVYCAAKDIGEAVKFFDSAIEFGKKEKYTPWDLSQLFTDKAWCLYKNKQYRLARNVAAQALSLTPFQYEASLVLGNYYLKMNDNKTALNYFSSIMNYGPNHPIAVCRIGLLLGPQNSNGLNYLRLCRTLKGAPSWMKRKAARMLNY